MNPKTRLNLVLAASALVAVAIASGVMYFELRRRAVDDVQREAALHMEAAQALRRYTADHIRPLLSNDEGRFHPESVPSFSAVTTMRELHAAYPGVSYREVALNPTNTDNLATGVHAEIVNSLRQTKADSLQRLVTEDNGEVLYLAKPLRVIGPSCLVCHSTPEAAPSAMRAVYGDRHGYGWQVGEVVGAQVVKVPMTLPLADANRALWQFLLGASTVVLAVFLALNTMLRQVLLNPMTSHHIALRREAREDPLTGAINRRGFMERAYETLKRARENGSPVSMVMIDVDHFKQINDTHGHAFGDEVLRELVQRVQLRIRRADVLGRLGGDEFALLLPGTAAAEANGVAASLLAGLQDKPYGEGGHVGFSLGAAQWDGAESCADLMARADRALYSAKGSGRAQVVLATVA